MTCRRVEGLVFAAPTSAPGFAQTRRRPRGTKGLGLRYERRLALALPQCLHNPWYEFHDTHGRGLASPDLVAQAHGYVVALECKLANVEEAEDQLRYLYGPILSHVYRMPFRGVIVTRSLSHRPDPNRVVSSLAEALAHPGVPVWHWLGQGPV